MWKQHAYERSVISFRNTIFECGIFRRLKLKTGPFEYLNLSRFYYQGFTHWLLLEHVRHIFLHILIVVPSGLFLKESTQSLFVRLYHQSNESGLDSCFRHTFNIDLLYVGMCSSDSWLWLNAPKRLGSDWWTRLKLLFWHVIAASLRCV